MTTRLGLYGSSRGAYGSFSGKELAPVASHPVDEILRLGLHGGPRGLYGSFSGKELNTGGGAGEHPVDEILRLGLHGGPRGLYGSFSGKELADPAIIEEVHKNRPYSSPTFHHAQALREDEELIMMIKLIIEITQWRT